MNTLHRFAWCLPLLLVAATAGRAQLSFTYTDLGTFGGTISSASAINASGQIVGYSLTATDTFAFSYTSGGGMVNLGTFGFYPYSNAYAINSSGQIVGRSLDVSENDLGFITTSGGGMVSVGTFTSANGINDSGQIVGLSTTGRAGSYTSGGGMVDLGTLGGTSSSASAINASGQIVGKSQIAGGADRAFSYTAGGGMVSLGTLGGDNSYANAINASGQIVGKSQIAGGAERAFSFTTGGGMVSLGTLGGDSSTANAINASGQIVGTSQIAGGADRAFYYSAGTMYNLNLFVITGLPGGVTLDYANGINDLGQIVGQASNGHAFLLTPIPEPSTYAAIFGAAALGFAVWRRRRAAKSV